MIWFYLYVAVLLAGDPQPPATIAKAYQTEAQCNAAGQAFAQTVRADKNIKAALWACQEVDFSQDLPPDHPAIPSAHIPGKDEA